MMEVTYSPPPHHYSHEPSPFEWSVTIRVGDRFRNPDNPTSRTIIVLGVAEFWVTWQYEGEKQRWKTRVDAVAMKIKFEHWKLALNGVERARRICQDVKSK